MSKDRGRYIDEEEYEVVKKIKRESSEIMGVRRQMLSPSGMTLNTITPCAACKLLRRRCAEECPFSPYFSPHEPQKFAAVHKVFGASNVSKMLMEVPESQRADAANSLVFEANLRLRDPVYGCMGAISALQQQLQSLQSELSAVRAEILKHKFTSTASNAVIDPSTLISPSGLVSIAYPPPPPPSIVVSSTSSSSSNNNVPPSLYTTSNTTSAAAATTTGFSSISSDNNVPFFD